MAENEGNRLRQRGAEGSSTEGVEFEVARTASAGVQKKQTHLRDLQLRPEMLDEHFPDVSEGDFLKITAPKHDIEPRLYGRIQVRDSTFDEELAEREAGVSITLRRALGVRVGDTVRLSTVGFPEVNSMQRRFNRLLKIRPAVCRVRKSVQPDVGHRVCRISEATREIIGIESGDRVVLQSADGRVTNIKALPITDEQRQQLSASVENAPDTYPDCFERLSLERVSGAKEDVPDIYISYSIRDELGIADAPHSGKCQPIKVHRDTRDLFVRLLHDLTTPVILGAVAVVIGFDIGTPTKALVLVAALGFTILSVVYQSRRVLLE